MPTTIRVSATSNQNIWARVRSDHPFFPDANLSVYPVEIAVTISDPVAGDWKPAVWEPTTKTINGHEFYYARLEIGPGGAVTLTGDETYQIHVRLTTAEESPALSVGMLYAY